MKIAIRIDLIVTLFVGFVVYRQFLLRQHTVWPNISTKETKIGVSILLFKMTDSMNNPLFFVGAPRSGTTIVFEAITRHPDLGWISNYCSKFPSAPYLGVLNRVFQGRLGAKDQGQSVQILNRYRPAPTEAYPVWDRLSGINFSRSFLRSQVPSDTAIRDTHKYVDRLLSASATNRLTAKFTGPPRISYLSKLFKNALFVEVQRNPLAVISSILKSRFWGPNGGLEDTWWEDALTPEEMRTWSYYDKNPVALVALQYRAIMAATIAESEYENITTVRYAQFVEDPAGVVNHILDFAGLANHDRIMDYVFSQNYQNMNYKYAEHLTPEELGIINEILNDQSLSGIQTIHGGLVG